MSTEIITREVAAPQPRTTPGDEMPAFFARVVPSDSYICVASKAPGGTMRHKFFRHDQLAEAARYAAQTSATCDVWHASASFLKPTERKQTNVAALRCFWGDLDIRREGDGKAPGKVYADQAAAFAGLRAFLDKTSLPKPNLIVNSGYGLHVYWVLEDPMAPAEWQPYAAALKRATAEHGLLCDASVTADSARLLRPPGTFNRKNPTNPVPVTLLGSSADHPNERVLQALRPFLGSVGGADVLSFPGGPPAVSAGRQSRLNAASQSGVWSGRFEQLTPDRMNACLRAIATDPRFIVLAHEERAEWLKILFGFAAAEQAGATGGRAVALAWCQTSGRFRSEADFDKDWRSFKPGGGVSVGTLLAKARDVGIDLSLWRAPEATTTVVNTQPTANRAPDDPLAPGGASSALTAIPAYLLPDAALQIMNGTFAFVHDWGGEAMLVQRHPDGRITATDEDQLRKCLANRRVKLVRADGRLVYASLAKWWLEHEHRCEVDRVLFSPEGRRVPAHGQTLNLWRGFSREPRSGSWRLMRRHLWSVICKRDKQNFKFLVCWLAHAVQHPETAPGSVVVMRSTAEGSGKSTVLEWMRLMFGEHAILLSTPEELLGEFNDHLEDKCFIGLNEPTFPGDHRAAGKLKSWITESTWWLNGKYRKRRQVPNIAHIALTTNREWAIPAGNHARRWLMLDVSEEQVGNTAYFRALNHEADNGGIEAMLNDLLRIDLSRFDSRNPTKTAALRAQQLRGADTMTRWALDSVSSGSFQLTSDLNRAPALAGRQPTGFSARRNGNVLYQDYAAWCATMRERVESRVEFGRWLSRLGYQGRESHGSTYREVPDRNTFAAAVCRAAGLV